MLPTASAQPVTVTLAITGASGSLLARTFLQLLVADERVGHIHLVASPSALRVLAEETGTNGRNQLTAALLGQPSPKVLQHAHEDIGASIASGSVPVSAMVVLPCSMGTLAGIAHGLAGNLIERAADVCLKERRRLVLCVREAPLNLIHLRNMTAATEAGAVIYPVIPTFYNKPQTLADMALNFAHRIMQMVDLPQPEAFSWGTPS